ncbi:MAG: hypothetical protein JNK00_02230 [Flavipsychrobacter sp.]|nr:hypothetical protein [Flavipsychrobacter sp.]
MLIKEILTEIETSTHPVAKALHKGEHFKVLVIGFKNGMVLKEHKAHMPSKLTVMDGTVEYRQGEEIVVLNKYDSLDIPVDEVHSVLATVDSMCLLTQG